MRNHARQNAYDRYFAADQLAISEPPLRAPRTISPARASRPLAVEAVPDPLRDELHSSMTYESRPASSKGQSTARLRASAEAAGTAPKKRESWEFVRLSPIIHIMPSGTV